MIHYFLLLFFLSGVSGLYAWEKNDSEFDVPEAVAVNTRIIHWLLARPDIDLSIKNNNNETIFDIVRDQPTLLRLLQEHRERHTIVVAPQQPVKPKRTGVIRDSVYVILMAGTLVVAAIEVVRWQRGRQNFDLQ